MPHSVVSDLGLHCLPWPVHHNTQGNYGTFVFLIIYSFIEGNQLYLYYTAHESLSNHSESSLMRSSWQEKHKATELTYKMYDSQTNFSTPDKMLMTQPKGTHFFFSTKRWPFPYFSTWYNNLCCRYTFEVPWQDASNEYHNICIFMWRNN